MYILSRPAIYALEITAQCDHHCVGCSNVYAADHTATEAPLPAVTWATILQSIAPDAVQLRITGGEPTLHPEFFEILDMTTSYEAWVTLSTHGQWAEPEALVTHLNMYPNISGLLLSLHGATAATHEAFTATPGSFAPTVANARLAAARGLRVAISTVITHYNWDEVDAIVALARRIGADQVIFDRYLGHPLPGVEATADELRAATVRIEALQNSDLKVRYGIGIPQCFVENCSEGCLAGAALAAVDPWGNLRPCSSSPTIIGSLLNTSIDTLWHSEAMDAWRARIPQSCIQLCSAYGRCHGGCKALQELRDDGRDPLRTQPVRNYTLPTSTRTLPANVHPIANHLRLQPETFGYAILGNGYVVPVSNGAHAVLEACNGKHSFADLINRFGDQALDLLGELWDRGLLSPQ